MASQVYKGVRMCIYIYIICILNPKPPTLNRYIQDVQTQPGYSSQLRVDFLGLKQYLQKNPSYSARLAAAPTRFARRFSLYQNSIGGAWRS